MKLRLAVLAALSITLSGAALAAKKGPVVPPPAQQSTSISLAPEVLAVINDTRALEAKLESGLNYRDYGVAVADLTAKFSALDEFLESKGDSRIRAQIADVRQSYQLAKEFWGVCVTSRDCNHSFISLEEKTPAAIYAASLLERYPEMRRPTAEGGAYEEASGYSSAMAYYPRLLTAIWADGKEKGKALRAMLR